MADELKDQRIPIMMSPSEVKAIDDWMFANRIKSRAQAIRRLCQASLVNEPEISNIVDKFVAVTDAVNAVAADFSNKDGDLSEEKKVGMFAASTRLLMDLIDSCHPSIARLATVYAISKTPHDSDDERFFQYSESVEKIHEALRKAKP